MTYVKIEKTKETLKSLKIRWANMLKNLLNQENNIFTYTVRVNSDLRLDFLFQTEGGFSLNLRSADKELKAVTPEK